MPHDVRLLKTERNAVLNLVQESGIEASEFEWKTERFQEHGQYGVLDATGSILAHKPTGFFYRFGVYQDQYSPGYEHRIENADVSFDKWGNRGRTVRVWLKGLREEIESPDLWQELLQENRLYQLASAPQLQNEEFIQEEKRLLIGNVRELRDRLISTHDLQLEQVERLDQGFRYLEQSLDRFGKKDWLNLAVGTLINIAVAAAFSPVAAKGLLHGFMSAVRPFFDFALKLIS